MMKFTKKTIFPDRILSENRRHQIAKELEIRDSEINLQNNRGETASITLRKAEDEFKKNRPLKYIEKFFEYPRKMSKAISIKKVHSVIVRRFKTSEPTDNSENRSNKSLDIENTQAAAPNNKPIDIDGASDLDLSQVNVAVTPSTTPASTSNDHLTTSEMDKIDKEEQELSDGTSQSDLSIESHLTFDEDNNVVWQQGRNKFQDLFPSS